MDTTTLTRRDGSLLVGLLVIIVAILATYGLVRAQPPVVPLTLTPPAASVSTGGATAAPAAPVAAFDHSLIAAAQQRAEAEKKAREEAGRIGAERTAAQKVCDARIAAAAMAAGEFLSREYVTRAIVHDDYGVIWTSAARDGLTTATELMFEWASGSKIIKLQVLPNGVDLWFRADDLPRGVSINATVNGLTSGLPPSLAAGPWTIETSQGRRALAFKLSLSPRDP